MQRFQKVYDENKKLDQMFDRLYNAHDPDIIRKNKLELLVELGELANESRCFKYWSNKAVVRDRLEDEYADCMIMVLCFFNMMNVALNEVFIMNKRRYDVVSLFAYLYQLCSEFYEMEDKNLIKEIFVYLVELGHLLGFSDDEIIDVCLRKIKRNYERFVEGF